MKTISLVGNPNSGKTTLYNSITRSAEHVGNWYGVTVDLAAKAVNISGEQYRVVDLPGVFSLDPFTAEEAVTRDFLLKSDGFVVNVCDANNVRKSLYLTLQLIELGLPTALIMNFYPELKKRNIDLDIDKLSQNLGIDVYCVNAKSTNEIKKLLPEIVKRFKNKRPGGVTSCEKSGKKPPTCVASSTPSLPKVASGQFNNYVTMPRVMPAVVTGPQTVASACVSTVIQEASVCPKEFGYLAKVNIGAVKSKLKGLFTEPMLTYNSIKVATGAVDEIVGGDLSRAPLKELQKFNSTQNLETVVAGRYQYIDNILKICMRDKSSQPYGFSKVDKIILNKYLALPIFFLLMFAIFFITFSSVGRIFGDFISYVIVDMCGGGLVKFVTWCGAPEFVIGFVRDALIGGVGSIFAFLPQIILLFLCLDILEQVGYLSRLAFVLEGLFCKIGLSGRSVFTLLMGFGCSTTAIPTVRALKNNKIRIKTAILTPYMSCSAKLPIYALIGGAFFSGGNFLVIVGMYLLGVAISMLIAWIMEKVYKSGPADTILEFTPYRRPDIKAMLQNVWHNVELFIVRVGTILLSLSVLVWFLQNFTFGLRYITDDTQVSMLEGIGRFLAPVFGPLGFGTWGAVSALLCGLAAKEMVVSAIAMLNGVEHAGSDALTLSLYSSASAVCFTPASALSFMVFCLLYPPCIAAITVLCKETKHWVAPVMLIVQFVIAWIISFLVYRAALLLQPLGAGTIILTVLLSIIFVWAIMYLITRITGKKCKGCVRCTGCGYR